MSKNKQTADSGIVSSAVGLLYPYIIVFSIYLIVNGHRNPGGGFQGGSMFAALFIIRILGLSVKGLNIRLLYALKKLLVFCIALIPMLVIFANLMPRDPILMSFYIISLQVLIGVNVGISFTIAVFRFVFYTYKQE